MRRTLSSGPWLFCRAVVFGLLAAALAACGSGDGGAGGGAGAEPWLHITPTWSSLYDGYFGPSGVGSCSSGSTCHSTLTQSGGIASNFICPDKDSCYTSLLGMSNLVHTQDIMDPGATPLLAKLRQPGGPGKMPSSSTFVFQPQDIDVIKTWISKGAKND